jgi:hypothetical protein
MNAISLQAVQFLPRFVSFLALVAMTWLIARFAKYLVQRATYECQVDMDFRSTMAKILANLAFWSVVVVMLPFIVNVAGLSTQWLYQVQQILAQIIIYWPLWMVLSLVVAGISYLVRNVPRFYVQVKGSFDTSHREA